MRISLPIVSILAALALGGATQAQVVVTTNSATDTLVAFSPVDGSLLSSSVFPISTAISVSAIDVNNEVWISEQTATRIVRYDRCGNVVGVIGPTFPGGAINNIRGMAFVGGQVYVTNSGTTGGAFGNAIVVFDTAGNYVTNFTTTGLAPSPFSIMPFQGDLLVAASSGNDDVHRFSLAGTSLGTFHNSTLSFAHQLAPASDGNVWLGVFTTGSVVKLDATTGAILTSFPASGARGVFELLNGNIMWTNSAGAWVYDVVTTTSTQVLAGSSYHLNMVNLPPSLQFACHKQYGAGCHSFTLDRSNLFELFVDVPSAKAALDGNALQFTLTANGYVANWLPGVAGALYVPPTGAATIVADASATTTTFTPSSPIPVPGGVAASWTISSEGVLTAGSPGNQGSLSTVTLANTAAQTGLAWYTWINQNPAEAGSGKIKTEEVGGVLYVTFDGVELASGTPTVAPSTYQFQVNMTTGDVTIVWTSFSISNSTSDVLVGCTLAGSGLTPVSQTLSSVSSVVLQPDATLSPMTLSAAPFPVINPSTSVTYTANDVPEFLPGSGIYLGTMFLSVNPLPAGFDLTGILTTVPGCNAYIATLDLDLGGVVNIAPTLSWNFTYDNVFFAPGNVIAAQAVALFDPAFPLLNGESGGFVLSNGLLTLPELQ
jgi:streptogramin lyase